MRLGDDPLDHAIVAHSQSLGLDGIDREFDGGGASVQNKHSVAHEAVSIGAGTRVPSSRVMPSLAYNGKVGGVAKAEFKHAPWAMSAIEPVSTHVRLYDAARVV